MRLEINREPVRFLPPYKTGASRAEFARTRSRHRAMGSQPHPNESDRSTSLTFGPFSQFGQTGTSGTPAWGNLDRVSQRRQRPQADRLEPDRSPIPDVTAMRREANRGAYLNYSASFKESLQ